MIFLPLLTKICLGSHQSWLCSALCPSYRVVLLAGLVHTLSLQADASFPTGCSFHGRQLLGQTHHLSLADDGAPQPRAHVHPRADGVLGAKGQAALADSIVALARKFLGPQEGLAWRVQETFSWGRNEAVRRTQPGPNTSCVCLATAALTVAIIEEVRDGGRGAAAPGLGGFNGGEDGGHETLIAVHAKALLAELRVVVRQTQKVTWGLDRSPGTTVTCQMAHVNHMA